MADSATNAPGGPSCVKRAVPTRFLVTPRLAVLRPVVPPGDTTTAIVARGAPVGPRSVRLPLRVAPVVFWKESYVSKLPSVVQAARNSAVSATVRARATGAP